MDWIKQIFRSSKSQDNLSDKQVEKQRGQLNLKGYKKQTKPVYLSDNEINKIVDDLIAQINQTDSEFETNQPTIQNSIQTASENTIKNIEKYFAIEIDNQKVDLNSSSVQVFDIMSHLSDSNTQDNQIMESQQILPEGDNLANPNIDDTASYKQGNNYVSAMYAEDIDKPKCIEPCIPSFTRSNTYEQHLVETLDEDWCLEEKSYTKPLHKEILKLNISDHPFQNSKLVEKTPPPKKHKDKSKAKEPKTTKTVQISEKPLKIDTESQNADENIPEESFSPDESLGLDKSPVQDKSFVPDDLFCLSQNKYNDYCVQRNVGKLGTYEFQKSEHLSSQREVGKLNIVEKERTPDLQIQKNNTRKLIQRDETVEEVNTIARNTDHLDTTIDSIEDPENIDESVFPLDDMSNQINKLNIVDHVPVQDESHAHKYGSGYSKKILDTQFDNKAMEEKAEQPTETLEPPGYIINDQVESSNVDIISNYKKASIIDSINNSKYDSTETSDPRDLEANNETANDKKPKNNILKLSQNVSSYFRDNTNFNLLKSFNNSIATLRILIASNSFRLIMFSKLLGLTFLLMAIFSNYWMVNQISYVKSGVNGVSSTYIGLFGITRQDRCTLQDGANVVLSRDRINFSLIAPSQNRNIPEYPLQTPPDSTVNDDNDIAAAHIDNDDIVVADDNNDIDNDDIAAENNYSEDVNDIPIDTIPTYTEESEFIKRAGVFRDSRAIGNLPQPLADSRSELFGYPFYDIEIVGIDDLMFAGKLSFFLFMISIFVLLTTIPFVIIQYFPQHRLFLNLPRDGCIFLGYLTKILWICSLLLHLSGLLVMMIYTRSSTCVDESGRSVPSSFSTSFWLALFSFIPFAAAYAFYTLKRRDNSPSNALAQFCDHRCELPLENVDNDTLCAMA